VQKFLKHCAEFGVQNQANRNALIKRSLTENCNETLMFLTCGYDFIMNANDRKFEGLVQLFVNPNGKYSMNVSATLIDKIRNMTRMPHIAVSYEGRGVGGNSGAGVRLGRSGAAAGGVRAGGAGNYNLQTKALEFIVTDTVDGLNKQSTLSNLLAQMNNKDAAQKWMASHQFVFDEMKADVGEYWGDTRALGLC